MSALSPGTAWPSGSASAGGASAAHVDHERAERFTGNPHWRLLLVVGFLGAYTTFSTFEYETGALLKDGEWFFAMLNIILSVVAGFIALKLGEMIAKTL